jgi:hypothetical protein
VSEAHDVGKGVVPRALVVDRVALCITGGQDQRALRRSLVAKAPVEALDESVLDRLSGRDVVPSDAAFLLPAHGRAK